MNLQELIDETLYGKKPKKKKQVTEKKAANKKAAIEKKQQVAEAKVTKFAEDFWWVKKDGNYGLATFSTGAKFISELPEVTAAGLAKAIMTGEKPEKIYQDFKTNQVAYASPILIKWLVTKEELKKEGVKDVFEYANKKGLPLSIMPDKKIVAKIQKIIQQPVKDIIGDTPINELTPEQIEQLKELDTKIINNLKELPIDLPNKKLTKTETEKIKKMMAKGTNPEAKYAEANIGTVIKEEDVPQLIEMAKKKLG